MKPNVPVCVPPPVRANVVVVVVEKGAPTAWLVLEEVLSGVAAAKPNAKSVGFKELLPARDESFQGGKPLKPVLALRDAIDAVKFVFACQV